MFSEGLPGGLGIFRGRFMAEVCMMKRVRFHLNFRYEDSLVSYLRTGLVIGVAAAGILFFSSVCFDSLIRTDHKVRRIGIN